MNKKILLLIIASFLLALFFPDKAIGARCACSSTVFQGCSYASGASCGWDYDTWPVSGASSCLVGTNTQYGTPNGCWDECKTLSNACKKDTCPDISSNNGANCYIRKDAGLFTCGHIPEEWSGSQTLKWDASEKKCVWCYDASDNDASWEREGKICGDTSGIYATAGSGGDCTEWGDGQCESACGADYDCDEKTPGTEGCDYNCKVVEPTGADNGDVPPIPPSKPVTMQDTEEVSVVECIKSEHCDSIDNLKGKCSETLFKCEYPDCKYNSDCDKGYCCGSQSSNPGPGDSLTGRCFEKGTISNVKNSKEDFLCAISE